jgi:DUF4097 and DUF4098 domain-containing protein YvlB
MGNIAAVVVLVAVITTPAWAQQAIHRSYRAWSPMSLTVENRFGPIRIGGGTGGEVSVTGTLARGDSLLVEEGNRRIEIRVVAGRHRTGKTSLEVRLPSGNGVDATTLDGALHVSNTGGVVRLRSGSGEIRVEGDVRTLTAETLSGAVISRAPARGVVIGTASGNIEINGAQGFLEISTVGGRVDVSNSSIAQGTITTVDGPVRFEGSVLPHAVVRFETYVGSIALLLPPPVDATFTVSTFGGSIKNGLGPEAVNTSRYAPGKKLSFTVGAGSAQVVVDSFGGNVTLGRAGTASNP